MASVLYIIMIFIHWFRRDLRLHDNPALLDALNRSAGHVVPLFIIDPAILQTPDTGAARVVFMLEALRALDQRLQQNGSRLIIRSGRSVATLLAAVAELKATGVTWNRDYTPFATRRDTQARAALAAIGVPVYEHTDAVIIEPEAVRTGAGRPYTVFTPFRRTWRSIIEQRGPAFLAESPLPAFMPPGENLVSEPIPAAATLGFTTGQAIQPAGEQHGLTHLKSFSQNKLHTGIAAYAARRDIPAQDGTSRLSPYLRMGCVAPRAALRAAFAALAQAETSEQQLGIETWISELAWRDFYYQILANFPHVMRGAFRPQYDAIAWENDPQLFAAWCAGQTGYPIVDAAMRQLASEAWMHNRARMIVASFLTKDLLIDWRWGARFFMQQLVDGDHASNNGGWQWAAGTGTDAQPYFRIFNPTSQGQKFDPQGAYVRRYVPELVNLPDRYIHAPWLMPPAEQRNLGIQIGRDYPAPIVEHAARRERALAMYKAARTPA
jgi:deoxyribodipyrimidine photo-lyase